jgi:hypothetical protein
VEKEVVKICKNLQVKTSKEAARQFKEAKIPKTALLAVSLTRTLDPPSDLMRLMKFARYTRCQTAGRRLEILWSLRIRPSGTNSHDTFNTSSTSSA